MTESPQKSRSPYQYYLLPSANPPPQLVEQHNQIYLFWRGLWREVFNGLKVDTSSLEDDFVRQDLIAAICANSGVMAVHLYSFFAIDALASREHRYMTGNYPPEYFERLKKLGVRTVMSMELMAVNPEWRKRKADVHIGAVLVGLAMDVMKQYGIDAAIAPARRDHKVHELAYSFGGEPVIENVMNHNVACDLLACRRELVKPHPNAEIQSLREALWQNRIDCSQPAPTKLKLAS